MNKLNNLYENLPDNIEGQINDRLKITSVVSAVDGQLITYNNYL